MDSFQPKRISITDLEMTCTTDLLITLKKDTEDLSLRKTEN